MILPYSTDAPIYHFPWMTITLIVVNGITFAVTMMGLNSDGWLLQYGNGLHPVEWLAYNFLHFGPLHLLGNMFFLWAFGIVVEGKLGWWKFLAIYLGIGVAGGFLIQVAMLGYRVSLDEFAAVQSPHWTTWLEPSGAMAQDDEFDMDDDEEMLPGEDPEFEPDAEMTPEQLARLQAELTRELKPGAGGASLIVFALLGIALVWAPKNEVSCFFLAGFRAGTFELEYLYFCGLKIGMEVLGTIFGVRGFEVTSEVAHVLGACLGFGVGAMFLKTNWVDCENWDLFAVLQNKHGSMSQVGSWQEAASVSLRRDRKIATPRLEDLNTSSSPPKVKKRRAKSRLVELTSLEDDLPVEEAVEIVKEPDEPPAREPRADRAGAPASSLKEIRAAIKQGRWNDALGLVRRQRATDGSFELPQVELGCLADGFFKAHNVRDGRAFLEEYIRRFPGAADRQRVKLAVLYVKSLKRPTAALKLLAAVDRNALPEDYRTIHQQAARQAQQMVADGIVDASE